WLVPDMRVLIFMALAASAVVALTQDPQDKVAHQQEASAASYNLPSRRLAAASAAGCFGKCRTSSIDRQDSGGRSSRSGRSGLGEETVNSPKPLSDAEAYRQQLLNSIDQAIAAGAKAQNAVGYRQKQALKGRRRS
ncbi:unnamed protein product, partial [Aphanomyces euteiches]